VVYATGDLLNLMPFYAEFSNRLKKSYTSDAVIHVANEQENEVKVTLQNDWNTWKFEAMTFQMYVWFE
jgi:hypothetical protein